MSETQFKDKPFVGSSFQDVSLVGFLSGVRFMNHSFQGLAENLGSEEFQSHDTTEIVNKNTLIFNKFSRLYCQLKCLVHV